MQNKYPLALKYSVKVGHLNIQFFMHESYTEEDVSGIVTPHNHHNCELRYVVSGTSNVKIDNTELTLESGDLVLIPMMSYHNIDTTGSSDAIPVIGLRFSIEMPTGSKKQELHAYKTAQKLLSSPLKLHDETGNILRYLGAISDEIDNCRLGYITAMQSYSALLFTEIFRLMSDKLAVLFPADELSLNGWDFFRIEQIFSNNYSNSEMTADECAKELNISRRQLDRNMYKLYGVSFSENLKNTRLEKAVYLLKYSNKTLIDISKECGFASYSAFYSSFKQRHQISPSEFRKTNASF